MRQTDVCQSGASGGVTQQFSLFMGLLTYRLKNVFVGSILKFSNCLSRNILKNNSFVVRSVASNMTGRSNFERLPKNIVPKHYILSLKPNLNKLIFDGTCTINLEVRENTDKIMLNALDLVVSKAIFKDESKKVIVPKSIEMSEEEETLSLSFDSNLPSGNGQLELEFQGVLNDKLKGFYRSSYTTPSGEKRFAACTQFEATDARRAFPCWDEPAIKATFDVTLIVPQDRVALSNMNVISDTVIESNLREVKYATSPIMSTYLLAFIVGEYDFLEGKTINDVLVRVYTPLEKKEQGRVALEASIRALEYYENYFKIAYPLPKLDLIALADFGSGAMENWGLVTYRETYLLVDPENSSALNKQYVALVVAHELAHQWFGNLVTMEWWTHLWLNEGFASFIEFLCVHHLFPEFGIWTQFVTDTLSGALKLDALDNSHPIEVPVRHPSEIREIFDAISYNKGSSIIRMLHSYIGDEFFRKGLNRYLDRHSYKNTQTEDLWNALEEVSGKPIGSVMSTWTKQKGFPVITVTSQQDGNIRVLSLSQEKYSLGCSDDKSLWKIPVSFSTSSNPDFTVKNVLFESKTIEVRLENVLPNQWVKLNPRVKEFYRVNYSKEMLSQLMPSIANQSIGPLDRLNILDDLFALVRLGQVSTSEILTLLQAYTIETDYSVWCAIIDCISTLSHLVSHLGLIPQFNTFCRQLFSKIHLKLGWDPIDGEGHLDTLLRNLILVQLVRAKDDEVIAEAKIKFQDHLSGLKTVPADIRSSVYRGMLSDCDEKTFDQVIRLYKDMELQEEKNRIASAFGSVPSKEFLQKVLEFSLSENVRSQNSVTFMAAVSLSSVGRDLTWEFVKDKIEVIRERYENMPMASHLFKYATQNFASEEKAKEIEMFFVKNPVKGTDRAIQQAIETVNLNTKWLGRDKNDITKFLSNYQ